MSPLFVPSVTLAGTVIAGIQGIRTIRFLVPSFVTQKIGNSSQSEVGGTVFDALEIKSQESSGSVARCSPYAVSNPVTVRNRHSSCRGGKYNFDG